MKLGIFDSGHGGNFVADKLRSLLPNHEYIVVNDLTHAPYGERTYEEIRILTNAAIQPLLNCDIIVLACNTATAAAITHLRELYPDKMFVGFEPMIKPAAQTTKTKHVTLLATKATADSPRTEELIAAHGAELVIDKPQTFGWARLIDDDKTNEIEFEEIEESVASGSDTVIIGCTHYIALIPQLTECFDGVTILEPTEAVARQIASLTNAQPPQ
jgi:glutamate racemase